MFRRERLIGLGRHEYLLAKFLSARGRHRRSKFAALRSDAALHRRPRRCFVDWQIPGLVLASCAALGIGLAISAGARSVLRQL